MLRSILFIAILAVAVNASDVIEGHKANFKEVTSEGFSLVEFYAPWCGHCKKLAPEWEKAATALKGQAKLVKVDATVESDLGSQYNIRGYPTIKVFRDGVVSEYEGGRTSDAIVAFVRRRLAPAVEVLATENDIKEFKLKNPVAVIAFAASKDDDAFFQYETQAKLLRDSFTFGAVVDAALFGSQKSGDVVLFKHFDDLQAVYDGDIKSKSDFSAFVKKESFRLLDEIGPENYRNYVERGIPIAWLFLDLSKKEDAENAKNAANAVAGEFKGKLSFVYLDGTRYAQMVQKYGHTGKSFPVFAIDNGDGKYFAFPEADEITRTSLTDFVTKYVAGTLPRTIKSEKTPDTPTVDGLTTIVGNTFEEVVLKSEKDVFIEFYAPWCGHCKQLAPIYKKLAASLKDVSTLTIGMMDATANDPSGDFDIQGFPTLYFVPQGKAPVQYDGERTADAMLAFIKKHATNPVNVDSINEEL